MVKFLAGPEATQEQAEAAAAALGCRRAIPIIRRGTPLGWIGRTNDFNQSSIAQMRQRWGSSEGIFLPGFFTAELTDYQTPIKESLRLMNDILDDEDVNDLLDAPYYASRLQGKFELLQGSFDESDLQEIVKIDVDALEDDDIIADDLWMKFSWLSYEDDDLSLRCRISFGLEGYEDVAADWQKQQLAADLTEAIFPESSLISSSEPMQRLLGKIMEVDKVAYVERIIYFNAPNGGAQFHQDVERGHAGVVFAQLYGSTAWFSISKAQLMDELVAFYQTDAGRQFIAAGAWDAKVRDEFVNALSNRDALAEMLECRNNDALEHALNRSPGFFKHLVEADYADVLDPGDVILLPQKSVAECAWHTVFCADDYAGHALSFAVREVPPGE
ncbi:MAG: hypothetical protein OEW58_02810 [Gammaproteobacteria bacterium]|nr:hypothetical protein [Gammaproteobacteria bacterium]